MPLSPSSLFVRTSVAGASDLSPPPLHRRGSLLVYGLGTLCLVLRRKSQDPIQPGWVADAHTHRTPSHTHMARSRLLGASALLSILHALVLLVVIGGVKAQITSNVTCMPQSQAVRRFFIFVLCVLL